MLSFCGVAFKHLADEIDIALGVVVADLVEIGVGGGDVIVIAHGLFRRGGIVVVELQRSERVVGQVDVADAAIAYGGVAFQA